MISQLNYNTKDRRGIQSLKQSKGQDQSQVIEPIKKISQNQLSERNYEK